MTMLHISFSLTKTLHLTLKMTAAQVVEMSITKNSLSQDFSHPMITLDKHISFRVVNYHVTFRTMNTICLVFAVPLNSLTLSFIKYTRSELLGSL